MREIKFRAWLTEEKKMVDVYRLDFTDKNGDPTFVMWYWVQKGTQAGLSKGFELMQFTGLYDRNGRAIYEGDILRSPANEFFEVFWSEKMNGWVLNGKRIDNNILQHLDIVGNVYENPELLGQ